MAASEADVIRWVGVAVSVVGAIIAAPGGTRLVLSEGRAWVGSSLVSIRSKLSWLPFLRETRHLTAAIGGRSGLSGPLVRTTHAAWDKEAPIAEKVEALHRHVDQLQLGLDQLREDASALRSSLAQQIASVDLELKGTIVGVTNRLDREAKEAARIDARGLPLIGLGIVLTGLPDGLSRWWHPFFGWALVGTVALFTAAAIRSALRSRSGGS